MFLLRSNVKSLAEFGPRVNDILDYIQDWSCGTGSALICLNGLVKELVEHDILDKEMARIVGKFPISRNGASNSPPFCFQICGPATCFMSAMETLQLWLMEWERLALETTLFMASTFIPLFSSGKVPGAESQSLH